MHQPSTFNNVLSPCISSSRKKISSLSPTLKASVMQQNMQIALTCEEDCRFFFVLYTVYGLLCPKSVGSCVLVLTGVYLRLSWLSWVYVKQTKNTKNLNIEKEIFLLSHNHCVMQHLQSVISTQTMFWRIFLTFINCFWFTECRSVRGCQVTLHWIDHWWIYITYQFLWLNHMTKYRLFNNKKSLRFVNVN